MVRIVGGGTAVGFLQPVDLGEDEQFLSEGGYLTDSIPLHTTCVKLVTWFRSWAGVSTSVLKYAACT